MTSFNNFEESVAIPHSSLNEAIATAQSLSATLGLDAVLDFSNFKLTVDRKKIFHFLKKRQSPETQVTAESKKQEQEQQKQFVEHKKMAFSGAHFSTYSQILERFSKSNVTDKDYWEYQLELTKLRYAVIKEQIHQDLVPYSTLIYGNIKTEKALVLPYPDGVYRQVNTVLHAARPINGKDLYDKNKWNDSERCIVYWVEDIDLQYSCQSDPGILSPEELRQLILERFKQPDRFMAPLEITGNPAIAIEQSSDRSDCDRQI